MTILRIMPPRRLATGQGTNCRHSMQFRELQLQAPPEPERLARKTNNLLFATTPRVTRNQWHETLGKLKLSEPPYRSIRDLLRFGIGQITLSDEAPDPFNPLVVHVFRFTTV